REGHAATVVDDVIYIFGGRGTDGNDLVDLAAFKLSNQRWDMFQNTGPAPNARSGNAMASKGSRVDGGEAFTPTRGDDHGIIRVLDTKHIKYSDSSKALPNPNGSNNLVGKSSATPSETGNQPPSQASVPTPNNAQAMTPPGTRPGTHTPISVPPARMNMMNTGVDATGRSSNPVLPRIRIPQPPQQGDVSSAAHSSEVCYHPVVVASKTH
ncbi:hypothetical protein PAXINDRAFT_86828, partial [Paxillus involutus ATCC 200175]